MPCEHNPATSPKAYPINYDSLGPRPVHLACYNPLDALDTLDLPDSDFAARDIVGRVSLHYAVMGGDIRLAQVVLERSERAGVDININDNDGWTPLLWAARASRIWLRHQGNRFPITDMISLLLENGTNPSFKGKGMYKDWTVHDVAYYHHDNSLASVVSQDYNDHVSSRKRGNLAEFPDGNTMFCDCCLLDIYGSYHDCSLCSEDRLCSKCYMSVSKVHPAHSTFDERGGEWVADNAPKEESVDVVNIGDMEGGEESDVDIKLDLEAETPFDDFDDEDADVEDFAK
ncbi:hypothetical protein FVEN_g12239 [Fusarium venenatum]|nr:hypothetical protein FVEN_g12239 [Fusarium venenatum]KAH6965025.1 hypothetical protein EDB82DRAFT_511408 [Fusarium venenatum]